MIDSSERLLLIAAEEGSMPANCFDRVSDFVSARTSAATWPSLRRLVLAAGLLLVLLLIAPALASAEPLCNDMWTGPSEGEWQTSADWSTKSPPTSKEVACIGSGKTVKVTMAAEADVVQGAGAVKLASGSLEVFNAIEASVLASLTISGGKLTGGATVEVSSSFSWTGESYLEGSGSLVVKSGATASIAIGTGSGWGRLVGRSLVNEGTTTFSKGQLFMSEGSQLKNTGTFDANSESGGGQIRYEPKNPPEPSVVNTGTFQKTEGTGTTYSEARFENRGTVEALSGGLKFAAGSSSAASKWHAAEKSSITYASGAFALAEASWSGAIDVAGGAVTLEKTTISAAQVTVSAGSLGIETGPMTVASLTMSGGSLTGTGTLEVATSFSWTGESYLEGGGSLVIKHGATATIAIATGFGWARLVSRSLLNEGTVTFSTGQIFMSEGSEIQNAGTFDANSEYGGEQFEYEPKNPPVPSFVNTGTFQKIEGTGTTVIGVAFVNSGTIEAKTGKFKFLEPISPEPSTQYGGAENPSTPGQIHATCGEDPVSCASGNLYESQTDVSVGGRGVGLDLTRTYNAQAAAAGVKGIFGYGWSSSFSDHLILKPTEHLATLVQANGSTVPFTEAGSTFTAPAWTQDTLSGSSESGYALTLPDQSVYRFAGASGRLESVTDRYGNATTLTYNSEGHPEVITDPTSRKLTLKYNSKHLVETATDPAGHITKYEYDETEDLAKVVKPGETTPRWHFEYESHLLTTVIDGREGKTINKYNKETNQLIEQTDPMKRVLTFTYAPFETRIKNVATGSETLERFTSADLPYSITRGYGSGSASETTEAFTYDGANDLLSVTDGNGHATKYTYEHGNRMSMVDPEKGETRWTYDSTHDVKTMTTPRGELTTIEREADGNAKFIEREAPKKEVQKTEYKYKPHGELEVVIDPLKREWKYEYDTHGNRTAESDPEGDKRTWVYDEDSRVTSSVSPNGHVEKATEAKFKTTIKRLV